MFKGNSEVISRQKHVLTPYYNNLAKMNLMRGYYICINAEIWTTSSTLTMLPLISRRTG